MSESLVKEIRWNEQNLVPVVAQERNTGRVLMLAWMNLDALLESLSTGYATYWSRSRQKIWRKGESSGNRQKIQSIELDCDGDAILLHIEQLGDIACHTGRNSCFYRKLQDGRWVESEPVLKSPKEIYGHD